MSKTKLNTILFLILACCWSGSFIGIKEVVMVWPPLLGAAVRVAIALSCLSLFIILRGKSVTLPAKLRSQVWMIGLFAQGIPFAFLFWGEHLIAPGLAGILNGTVSIWAFLLSIIFLPAVNQCAPRKILGLLIGMVGVAIIFWPIISFTGQLHTLWGAAAIVVMAISYAIGALLNQHFLAGKVRIDFYANIFHQHCASLVFLFVLSLSTEHWLWRADLSQLFSMPLPWLASLYLGLFSTAVAWFIYYHLIREWDAVRASAVMYLVPALALVWDFLFYGRMPHLSELLGVATILTGVILIQLSNLKRSLAKC